MSSADRKDASPSAWSLWRRNGLIWAALLVLLISTFGAAYVPMGALNTPVSLLIAALKAGLVAVLYMELERSSPLIRLAALTGLLFLVVLFALTGTDVVTRVWNGWRA